MSEVARILDERFDIEALDDAELQKLVATAVRAYAAGRSRTPALAPFPPRGDGPEVTPSEAVTLVSAILEAVQVELFEVQLWRSWGEG